MIEKKIGIIGLGIVGSAVKAGFKKHYDVVGYDEPKGIGSIDEVSKCDFIFVALPTPMTGITEGCVDLTVMDKIVAEVAQRVDKGYQIIIVKSSVPPGTMERYAMKYPDVKFVYNPEFLTAKNAVYDFQHQDRIVIGSNHHKYAYDVGTLYRHTFPDTPILYTGFGESQMIKYASNCYLATKVIYANEIYRICKVFEINYDLVKEGTAMDKRIGPWGWEVPGSDGQHGFGNACFPKDICALISKCEEQGYTPPILKAVWDANLRWRSKYDWANYPSACSQKVVIHD